MRGRSGEVVGAIVSKREPPGDEPRSGRGDQGVAVRARVHGVRSAVRPQSAGGKVTKEERLRAAKVKQELQNAIAICDDDIRSYSLVLGGAIKSPLGESPHSRGRLNCAVSPKREHTDSQKARL